MSGVVERRRGRACGGLVLVAAALAGGCDPQTFDRFHYDGQDMAVSVDDLAMPAVTGVVVTPNHALTGGGAPLRIIGPWTDCSDVAQVTIEGRALVGEACTGGVVTGAAPARPAAAAATVSLEVTIAGDGGIASAPFRYFSEQPVMSVIAEVPLVPGTGGPGLANPRDIDVFPRGNGHDVVVTFRNAASLPSLAILSFNGRQPSLPRILTLTGAIDARRSVWVRTSKGPEIATMCYWSRTLHLTAFDMTGKATSRLVRNLNPETWAMARGSLTVGGNDDLVTFGTPIADRSVVVPMLFDPATTTLTALPSIDAPASTEFDQQAVAIADFNGDGVPDIVTLTHAAPPDGGSIIVSRVIVHLLDANAAKVGESVAYAQADPFLTTLAVGDLDGDGKPDVVAGTYVGNATDAVVMLNDGTGGFSPPSRLGAAGRPTSVETGDLNGDGLADFASAGMDSALVDVWTNRGVPGKLGASISFGQGAIGYGQRDLVIADIDGDGLKDLAVTNPGMAGSHSVTVYFNDTPQP